MKARQDLLCKDSPEWLEVFQLTTEETVPSSHIYMEAQIFHPDSGRFILHRSATPHGGDKNDPEHQYLICDVENEGKLIPITEETGCTAPSVSPDGQYLYYFLDETEVGGGKLSLKRVRMDGTERETILVIDAPIPGTDFRPSFIYPLSTISSDGKRIALSCYLRAGDRKDLPHGLMIFEIDEPSVRVVLYGNTWTNMHPQYCRSQDSEESHDVMIQHNHSHFFDRTGVRHFSVNGLGNDIHVVRDDGTNLRVFPWGRDPNERCGGHECWIGRTTRGIGVTTNMVTGQATLTESHPVPDVGHLGKNTPGGKRNFLSRSFPDPNTPVHFGVDIEGKMLLSDEHKSGYVVLAKLLDDEVSALQDVTPLVDMKTSWRKETHPHPFLSPNAKLGFFNSDESGILQAYMARGW